MCCVLTCGLAAAAFHLSAVKPAAGATLRDAPRGGYEDPLKIDVKNRRAAVPAPNGPVKVKGSAEIPEDQSLVKWKLTFQDDFSGPGAAGVSPDCYTRTPLCVITGWGGSRECPEYAGALKNLNKCVWRAWDFYNFMDDKTPVGQGVNYFDPSEVLLENGKLVLRARRSRYGPDQLDCKNPMTDPVFGTQDYTKKCPFVSGGVDSRPDGDIPGADQLYGRFEVYGKLSAGPGTWPAFWMLPTNPKEEGGWPHSGELDLMEAWSDNPNRMKSGIIGDKIGEGNDDLCDDWFYKDRTLTTAFHLYAVEWTPDKVRYLVDNKVVGSAYKTQVKIPSRPFYWLLNLTIERGLRRGEKQPDIYNFQEQRLEVDYVKNYRKCAKNDDPRDCITIDVRDEVDQYNTYNGETAFADINVYPNPQLKGRPVNVRVTSKQYCEDFRVNVYDMTGRQARELYKGPWERGETKYFELQTDDIAAAMYLLTASYRECEGGGKGNHAFKFLIQ